MGGFGEVANLVELAAPGAPGFVAPVDGPGEGKSGETIIGRDGSPSRPTSLDGHLGEASLPSRDESSVFLAPRFSVGDLRMSEGRDERPARP